MHFWTWVLVGICLVRIAIIACGITSALIISYVALHLMGAM